MELLGTHPGRKAIVYFAVGIIVGTLLLSLPVSAAGDRIAVVDALFTATSAICVTGLIVVDTGHDYSLFGQIVVLVLIQLGGIGIMTFATALLLAAGAKLSFAHRLGLSESYGAGGRHNLRHILIGVAVVTFAMEFFGAVALFFKFNQQFSTGQAVYVAVFHSISAFCNAGFSTFSNSLEHYQGDLYIIAVFSVLIITGGLGFAVIGETYTRVRNKSSRLSLHTRLCVTVTALLLVLGTAGFLTAEYENAFADAGAADAVSNAFFQAVTARTAGFNTLPQRSLSEVSLLLTMMLMFIGACPGSTAGGIKTTTFAIIFLLVYNRFRGRESVSAFRRSISRDSINRALTVILLAVLVIMFMFAFLMFAAERPVAHRLSHGWFVDNLFEMVSAFGTVGLSLGMTSHVDWLGKIVLIVTMFVGRVGLLTLAFALARPPQRGEIVYAEESVMVG